MQQNTAKAVGLVEKKQGKSMLDKVQGRALDKSVVSIIITSFVVLMMVNTSDAN